MIIADASACGNLRAALTAQQCEYDIVTMGNNGASCNGQCHACMIELWKQPGKNPHSGNIHHDIADGMARYAIIVLQRALC